MARKESIIAAAILVLITYTFGLSLVSEAFPANETTRKLSSSGTIEAIGVGVFSDAQCTSALTSVAWGTLEPGSTQDVVCYIKNEGNSASTLSMYPSNWSPASAENYLTLSWNYDGRSIIPDAAIQVTLTLSVDENIQGITSFSFDITIVGSST